MKDIVTADNVTAENSAASEVAHQDGTGAARVLTTDDAVYVERLTCHDPNVRAALAESHDPERTLQEILATGALVLKFTSTSQDGAFLESTVQDLERSFQERLDATVTTLDETTKNLLDPESGSIPGTLHQVRDEIAKKLSDTFDPALTDSAMSIIDKGLKSHLAEVNRDVRRLLDPTSEDSPLRGLEVRLREANEKQTKEVGEAVSQLLERMAVNQAESRMAEKSTAKGFAYEDVVEAGVERIASLQGDEAVNLGKEPGVAGNLKGDIVVTLASEDSAGQDLRFVIECKDKSLSKPAVRRELDAAMENRAAAASILAFASSETCPYSVPFTYHGNQAVVVYDGTDPDDQALAVAYAWARWVARRSQQASEDLDAETILNALHDAEEGLKKKREVLKGLTQASKGIEASRTALNAMSDAVEASLRLMRATLDS